MPDASRNHDAHDYAERIRDTDGEILLARFREEDVIAGKLVSQDAALKSLVKSKAHGMSRVTDTASSPKDRQ